MKLTFSAAAEIRTIPTVPVSWRLLVGPKRLANAATVPETTCQQSAAASRALSPIGYETSSAAGTKPQIQWPPDLTVLFGPSTTFAPLRRTVTVIGLPSLPRIRVETRSNVGVAWPFTATTRSPGRSPATAAGMPESTSPTFVLAFCEGAPVV